MAHAHQRKGGGSPRQGGEEEGEGEEGEAGEAQPGDDEQLERKESRE